jgi:hypothetical protein
MAREILGLLSGAGNGGDKGDHRDLYNTLKNTRDNLRVGNSFQSLANRRNFNNLCRFKGIQQTGSGFRARVCYNYQAIEFQTVKTDVEAALMYNYAAYLLHGEFANLNEILEDEMPSYERQVELYDMVFDKLRRKGVLV